MGSLRPHGAGWQISYYQDGVRQYEQYATEEKAEERLAKIALAKTQGLTAESRPHTIRFKTLAAAVVHHYLANDLRSVDDIEDRYRLHLNPVFGSRKAVRVTTAHVNAYIIQRKREGAATGTINRELEAMKRAYNLGLKSGTVLSKPYIPMLRETNVREGFFSREEVDRLTAHMPADLGRMVLFGFLTGWRLGEIQGLEWRNVDFKVGEIRLDPGTTKNRKGRVFPFTREIRGILETAIPKAKATVAPENEAVTPMKAKGMPAPAEKVFRQGAFRKTWATANHLAGLPCTVIPKKDGRPRRIKAQRTFHDLRRSAAREMVRQGIPEKHIMALMGWETRSVFDRYNIVSGADLREAVKRLDGANSGASRTPD